MKYAKEPLVLTQSAHAKLSQLPSVPLRICQFRGASLLWTIVVKPMPASEWMVRNI